MLKVLSLEPLDALPLNLSTRPKEEEACLDDATRVGAFLGLQLIEDGHISLRATTESL